MATKLLTLDNNLLSIGADGTLHTVHWDNGSDATPALTPHSNAIRGLVSHENVVVTGSTDGTIKIWKRGNYDVPAYQLIEPAYVVWQLDSVGDKLVAAYVKSETEKVVIAAWDLGALQAP
jgi:WD40 repeat protein